MEGISILLIIVPFVAASFVLLNRFTTCLLLAKMVSLGAVLLCLFFLLLVFPAISRGLTFDYPVGGWKEPVGINLYMDGLAWITSLIGMGIALFCLLYSIAENYDYKFYFFFLTLLGGMQGVIFTQDIFNMFVFFEILSIASYILIAYPGKENWSRYSLPGNRHLSPKKNATPVRADAGKLIYHPACSFIFSCRYRSKSCFCTFSYLASRCACVCSSSRISYTLWCDD